MIRAASTVCEGQVWEVAAENVYHLGKNHIFDFDVLEVGTKFIVSHQVTHDLWRVLIWGEAYNMGTSNILLGCKILSE